MAAKKNNNKQGNAPLSKAQEEEMSSALIARLLAEDAMSTGGNNDYYAEYSNDAGAYEQQYHARGEDDNDDNYEDDSGDDSYAPKKKKSRAKAKTSPGPARRGRKRKATESESDLAAAAATTTGNEKDADGATTTVTAETQKITAENQVPAKKPRKPVPEGCNTGVYSEEEEARFLEGLENFGRDWPKMAAHIRTRDSNSIRSHAQKHFIKMYRDNIPLPDKVRESGEGYTLSGKPLDPNSSAAKAYLGRSNSNQKPQQNGTAKDETKKAPSKPQPQPSQEQPQTTQELQQHEQQQTQQPKEQKSQQEQIPSCASDPATPAAQASTVPGLAVGERSKSASPPTTQRKAPRKDGHAKPRSATPEQLASAYDENGRTNYSKLRLRRTRERPSIMYSQLNKDDDPLTMIKCEPFNGKPGSNMSGCQPFELQVHSNVLLEMDFHAHLMTTEIIGFLAGEWDKVQKKMCIKEAFPCRSLNTGQNDVNVEMDPTSAIETRQLIEEKNMTVVGWYHSHPTFIPDPSIVDLENQRNYQVLCREKCNQEPEKSIEPFVGAIVGPYDPRLPGSASVINWFYVGDSNDDRKIPKRLIYELQNDQSISSENADRLINLLDVYKDSPEKVDFTDHWRQDVHESKLEKLIKSLGVRMPWMERSNDQEAQAPVDSFLTRIRESLKGW
ncbi:hypothetical protein BDB00DRAFT_869791 [Zychaea mexicana]|uniref:uncharacterized protein n=1 Tax=Zychaea mexicana TaxID=64656 RepID=UPI0022FE3AF7|nr:uncharacterized protein BDB00DRAFT_869791 [Zychaea mexicana]KAI9496157.1 hypothetical protein BDB00DRAFT_869791 [Zychaea mexicana]